MVFLKFHCISLHQFLLLENKLLHLTFAKKLVPLSCPNPLPAFCSDTDSGGFYRPGCGFCLPYPNEYEVVTAEDC